MHTYYLLCSCVFYNEYFLLFTLHNVMCTQVCMKIGPKKVSEDQRLARKFACSEILEKIGAGKNVLKTDRLPCKLAFQYDPNKASFHTMENSCSSKTTKLDCEPRILRLSFNIVTGQDLKR